jgi:hypothetical protein
VRTLRRVALAFLLPFAVACTVFLWLGQGSRRQAAAHAIRPGTPDARGVDGAGRTPAEERALLLALATWEREKGSPALRVAEDGDAGDSDARSDLEDLYAEYHPYFVRGDLDGDGRVDFAQAFVETGRAGAWFHVAVFFGREGGGFGPPVWVERAVSLAGGDLSIDRSLLVVTPDLAADESRRWRFDRTTGTFVDADEAAPLKPGSDDGVDPDEAPRARI